jgi:hypothetical protein
MGTSIPKEVEANRAGHINKSEQTKKYARPILYATQRRRLLTKFYTFSKPLY